MEQNRFLLLALQTPFDIVIDKVKCLSKKHCIGEGGGEFTNIVSLLQDLKSWSEVYIEHPTHLQYFKFIDGFQLGVAHGPSLEQQAVNLFPHQPLLPQSKGDHRISPGFFYLEVFVHNPQDVNFIGIADEPAMKNGLLVLIFRDTKSVVKKNGATYDLALGKIQGLEDVVPIQLREGKLGVVV